MKPDHSQPKKLKEAQDSVKVAQYNLMIDVAAPHWRIRERILKKAKALVPTDLPDKYRVFLEMQFNLIVETPGLYEVFRETFKKVENDIWGSLGDKATKQQRKKVLNFIRKKGPLKLLEEHWPTLVDLRYEFFAESALKILHRAIAVSLKRRTMASSSSTQARAKSPTPIRS
jgi:hypothetical protein